MPRLGCVGLHPDRVDARIGAAAAGHLLDRLVDVGVLVVDRFRPGAIARNAHAIVDAIDGDHPLGAQHVGTLDRELTDRAAAPYRDHVTRLNVAGSAAM